MPRTNYIIATLEASLSTAERRAEMYSAFIPEWPALAEEFRREADELRQKILEEIHSEKQV